MKNESKIEELLAESLKKQDQMIDLMGGMNTRLDKLENTLEEHTNILKSLVTSVNGLADLVKHALEQLKRMDQFEERLRKLEEKTGHL